MDVAAGAVGARPSGWSGPTEHAASIATIVSATNHWNPLFMGLILLEALGAGILLALIVWWTMFSGRRRGELHADEEDEKAPPSDEPPSGRSP
ncbi:hypothetical protein GCM10023165_55420 [Variovorax defluvii]|uniref:Uncharacterized protein n=1 Tax=Variovorax defluvii TaxID=913761 RepID=A0ABP8IIH5_9BURK